MNKAITDGFILTPPPFSGGLDVWSIENGTPGTASYDGASNATFVPADPDFGGCLELTKTETVQRLRFAGETPILPGCYLQIKARVKAVAGNFPGVRIAGWPAGPGGVYASGLVETGAATTLTTHGEIVEITAIVGSGTRTGVDMPWGAGAIYGHFGLDLTGASGGVVRIDDIEIHDVTAVFHRTMMDWVDVRDFGALGDGLTNDQPAFEAADLAARGRSVLVPAGTYFLGADQTFESAVRFEGTITMADSKSLVLRRNFDLPTYADAFGDDVLGFKKAFQALLNFPDHDGLDLGGRQIEVSGPIDLAAVTGVPAHEARRVIRNGQFICQPNSAWDTETFTSVASYSVSNPLELSAVANVANIPVGSLIEGAGVGREVYVTSVNVGSGTLEISQALWGPAASQTYAFKRFKYVLDFSGYAKLSHLNFVDVEFNCARAASGVLLAPAGELMQFRDCVFTKPKDRGISSIGRGCQDLHLEGCHFISEERALGANQQTLVGLNVNANDARIRDNRFERMGVSMVLHGNRHLIAGNHFFQRGIKKDGSRLPGLVFAEANLNSVVSGNYIHNSFIEWTNEHDANPDFSGKLSFGGLSIMGNIFACDDAVPWFSWLVVKPFGAGQFLNGISVTGNTFKSLNGNIDRIEKVDSSIADLDFSHSRNVTFSGNTFNNVTQNTINPVTLEFDQTRLSVAWQLDVSGYLPFGGWARDVTSVVTEGPIVNAASGQVFAMPYVTKNDGPRSNLVRLTWPEPVRGRVHVTARTDRPI